VGKKLEARKILKHGDSERWGTAKGKSGRELQRKRSTMNCSGSIGTRSINDLEGSEARRKRLRWGKS
jgi:hypothetical protein